VARTPEAALLTERHRRLQLTLSATTVRDLLRLWSTVDPDDLAATIAPFTHAGSVLVRGGRKASAAAAGRYYVDFRRMEGIRGTTFVTLPAALEATVVEGALRGAGLAGIKRARQRGATAEQAHRNGFVKLAGQASSLVLGGGREALMGAISSDPASQGWQRVTSGGACAFCRMIAGRGLHSKDEGALSFESHGHCGCTAEPFFEGSGIRPDNARFAAEWQEATQGLSGGEALNAYRQSLAAPQD
jgi:hypothetical protein